MPQRPHGRRLRRFIVDDRSMEPALQSGQGLVGWRTDRATVGQLRCLEHPHRPGFWLVKRVESLANNEMMTVRSDNRDVATIDSETFGAVPIAGSYRVLLAVPMRLM